MNTIKSNEEINYLFKNGKKLNFPYFNCIFFEDKNNIIHGNVAFIAGKKNGNAVWRNKSKRILREVYKELNIKEQYKILLIANKNLDKFKYNEIIKESKIKLNKYINNE